MKLTKYEHACVSLEEQGQKLIIDPGMFSHSLQDFANIVAVVITHQHSDHYDPKLLAAIIAQNPEVQVFTPQDMVDAIAYDNVTPTADSFTTTIGPFSLAFKGSEHAPLHPDLPVPQNVGVDVNSIVFYPGDSFTAPLAERPLLLLPFGAPWLRADALIDYLATIPQPTTCVPTHDTFLSDEGKMIMTNVTKGVLKKRGITLQPLSPRQSIEL